jgi:acyl carrier protein
VLGLDSRQSLDDRLPLADLGLDSLMAVELRSLMSRKLGRARSLPAAFIFDYPTVAAIADYLAEELLPTTKTPEPKPESSKPSSIADILGRIEDLSEEEVDRMYSPEKSV